MSGKKVQWKFFGRRRAFDEVVDSVEKKAREAFGDDLTPEEVEALDPSEFTVAGYEEADAERIGYSDYSYWRSTFKVFWQNKMARYLLIALVALVLFTIVQPYLPNQKPAAKIFDYPDGTVMRNVAPNGEFWFGRYGCTSVKATRTISAISSTLAILFCQNTLNVDLQ